jgi:replicative DNA helicase
MLYRPSGESNFKTNPARISQFPRRGSKAGGNGNESGNEQEEKPIPHSVEAEEAVLGSLLLDRDLIATVASSLKPEHFFGEARANLYRALLSLYGEREAGDLVTINTRLKAWDVLGEGEGQVKPSYLLKLMYNTPTPVHLVYYQNIVLRHALARAIIAECATTTVQAFDLASDPNEVLAEHTRRLQTLAASYAGWQAEYFLSHEQSQEYVLGFYDGESGGVTGSGSSANLAAGGNKLPPLRFGWPVFDGEDWASPPTLCLLPATLTTLLARTGGGKTMIAMQIADTNAKAGLNVLYFHVELNHAQMMARRFCRLTGFPVLDLLTGRLGKPQKEALVQAAGLVSNWPGRVDFVHCPNWSGQALVQELKAHHHALLASTGRGYDLVVLDYLQRLGRSEQTLRAPEHEALGANVRLFSDAINELNVAGLMCSQVGRSESKKDEEDKAPEPPTLEDGLGSGDIERCSNQLLAVAIDRANSLAKYAIRKNTMGQAGLSGTLLYNAQRLCLQ